MTRMQNIEHTVGHHHLLTATTRGGHRLLKLFFAHDAKTGIRATANGVFQLDGGYGWRPEFTHHDTRGGVSKETGLFQCLTGGQRRRQHANHRITGTGHVIHFLSLSGLMQRRFTRL